MTLTDEMLRAAFMERVRTTIGNRYGDGALSDASTEEDVAQVRELESALKASNTIGEIMRALRDNAWDYPAAVTMVIEALIPETMLREDELDAAPSMYEFDT